LTEPLLSRAGRDNAQTISHGSKVSTTDRVSPRKGKTNVPSTASETLLSVTVLAGTREACVGGFVELCLGGTELF
jgi:hypothetical protein